MTRVSSSLFSVLILDRTHALAYTATILDQLSLATSSPSSKKAC